MSATQDLALQRPRDRAYLAAMFAGDVARARDLVDRPRPIDATLGEMSVWAARRALVEADQLEPERKQRHLFDLVEVDT